MSSKAQRRGSDYRRKRKRFHANQYTRRKVSDIRLMLTAYLLQLRNCAKKIILTRNNVDLPPPVSQKSYERILQKVNLAIREVADDSMKNAAKEEVSASGSNEICVSGDGTWKTRGHTSRIGVCSVIGDVTGKVIDVAVLSSYCK
ncbi:uncharacterized protein TNCV_4276101 [Trichonephila clavipes]|nr:uncharacterized protein TNCV_4276101 [Trichonephila clavipes]